MPGLSSKVEGMQKMSAELNKVLSQIQVEAQHLHVDSIAPVSYTHLTLPTT